MDSSFLQLFSEQQQITAIRETNAYAQQFGLFLTEDDIQQLLMARRECLLEQQRIEFGAGIIDLIILAFCDSDFIQQDRYAETIARLQDIFYLYKNEAMDELTDEELLQVMREGFDGECQGALSYLEETYLEQFARSIRARTHKFIGRYARDDEEI